MAAPMFAVFSTPREKAAPGATEARTSASAPPSLSSSAARSGCRRADSGRYHPVAAREFPADARPAALEGVRLRSRRGAESLDEEPLDGLREEVRLGERQRDHPFGPRLRHEDGHRRPAVGIEPGRELTLSRERIEPELRRELLARLRQLLAARDGGGPIGEGGQVLRHRAQRRRHHRARRMRREQLFRAGRAPRTSAARTRRARQERQRESGLQRPRRERTMRWKRGFLLIDHRYTPSSARTPTSSGPVEASSDAATSPTPRPTRFWRMKNASLT